MNHSRPLFLDCNLWEKYFSGLWDFFFFLLQYLEVATGKNHLGAIGQCGHQVLRFIHDRRVAIRRRLTSSETVLRV